MFGPIAVAVAGLDAAETAVIQAAVGNHYRNDLVIDMTGIRRQYGYPAADNIFQFCRFSMQ